MEALRKEGEPKNGVDNVNIRKITFDTEGEESLMDEIRVLLDVIIEADSRSKAPEKTFDAEETRRLYGKSF